MQPKDNQPTEPTAPEAERSDHEVLSQTADNPEEAAELAQMMRDIKGEPRSPLPKFVRYLGFSLAAIAFLALALMTVVLIQDVPFATRVYGPKQVTPGQQATFRIALFEPEKTRFLNNIEGKIWIMSRRHKHLIFDGKTSGKVLIANVQIPEWKPSSPATKHRLLIKVKGPRGKESFKHPITIIKRQLSTPHYSKETSQSLWDAPKSSSKPYRYKLFAKGRALVADLPNELLLQVQVSKDARPAPTLRPQQPALPRPAPARPRATSPRPAPATSRPLPRRPSSPRIAPGTMPPTPPRAQPGQTSPSRKAPSTKPAKAITKPPKAAARPRQPAAPAARATTKPTSRPTTPRPQKAPAPPKAPNARAKAPNAPAARKAPPSSGQPSPPPRGSRAAAKPPAAPRVAPPRAAPRAAAPARQPARAAARRAAPGRRAHRSRQPLLPFALRARAPQRPAPAKTPTTWITPKKPVFVTVYDGSQRLGPFQTDAYGVIRFPYMPQLFRFDWKISLEGAQGKTSYQQQLKPEGYQVLLSLPRAIYPAGQAIKLRLDCLQRKGVFHIDLVQRGRRLWSTRVAFEGGKKSLTITPPKGVRGLISIQVYTEFYYPGEIYDARLLYIGKPSSAAALVNLVEQHLSQRGDGMDITHLDGLKQSQPKRGPLNPWARHLFALAKARFVPPSLLYDSKTDRHKRLRTFQAKFRDQTLFSLGALGGFVLLGIFGWLSWGYRRDQLAMQRAEREHEDIEAIKTRGLPWLIGFFITLLLIFISIIYLFWAMKWTYDNL